MPRIEVEPPQRLVLTGLPPILAHERVKEHLTTGLTTSIYFRPGGKLVGGARIDIRYDLWDEVFHFAAAGLGGRLEPAEAASFDELLEWWRTLRLVILEGTQLAEDRPHRLEITAEVVPFSRSERRDAQRWFSESIDRARRSGTGEVGRSGEKQTEALSRTFDLLLATSIRRRTLASYTWTVTLPPSLQEEPEENTGGSP